MINRSVQICLALILLCSCAPAAKSRKIQPHSMFEYNYVPAGEQCTLRVWTIEKIRRGDDFQYVGNEKVSEGAAYELGNGSRIRFRRGVVTLGTEQYRDLSGNYIVSDGHLVPGFIRTFE